MWRYLQTLCRISVTKCFLIIIIIVSFGAFWYLDSKYYQRDPILHEQKKNVDENIPEIIKNDTLKKDFVPTNEWKTIENDQPIPPGLHISMNLQTGEKKAKLMDNNINSNVNSLTQYNNSENLENPKKLDNLHKFKSYAQLQNDLKELNMTVKSDMEIMEELSTKFKEQIKLYEDSEKNLINILTDLEYLLHQVDTAEVFIKNNGIELVVIPCINSKSSFLKAQGALILGSAASNNQKVQIAALKADVIPFLLNHINDKYDISVQKNCFFALSSIVRRFPTALKQVIEKNGIQIFMSVFKSFKYNSNTVLKLKVSQLLEDLIFEIDDAELTLKEETNEKLNSEAKERVRQYDELHLKEKLVENEWCEIMSNEFTILSNSLPSNEENHEMIEAFGKSLLGMSKLCKVKLHGDKQLYKSLITLETYYKKLSQNDNFFNLLYNLINNLTNTYDPVLE